MTQHTDQLAEPTDLDVAIHVARQLLDSDQVLSLREALRLLLRALDAEPDAEPDAEELISGTRPCGHDDYHDAHEWADRPGVWCSGHSVADEETHVVADDSDDPEHVDDCPGCTPAAVVGGVSGTNQ